MTDLAKALLDPTSVYALPKDVVKDASLSRDEKIKVLRQWEYDSHELQIADSENMPELTKKHHDSMLAQVLAALRELEQK